MACQYLCATWLIQAALMINQWSGQKLQNECVPTTFLQLSNPINKTAKTIGSDMKRLAWCIHAFTNKSNIYIYQIFEKELSTCVIFQIVYSFHQFDYNTFSFRIAPHFLPEDMRDELYTRLPMSVVAVLKK